jgi:hypothetical protein
MLKFFRNIRNSLIQSNNGKPGSLIGRYIFYAIGEILLVVFGILIALKVNNWNDSRIRSQKAEEILTQIKSDIEDNLGDVSGDLAILKLGVQAHMNINRYLHSDAEYVDSMCFDFFWLIKDEYTTANRAGFDALNDIGFDIIKNDTLKWSIKSLYEAVLPRISKEGAFYSHLSDFIGPYYYKHFTPNTDTLLKKVYYINKDTYSYPRTRNRDEITYVETIGYVPLDFEKLKKDSEFLMLVDRGQEMRWHKLTWYSRAKTRMEDLVEILNKELQKS